MGTILSQARCVNPLMTRQKRRHFANIFTCIFLNEKVLISIKIPLNFIPKCPINNIPALVQIMGWWQLAIIRTNDGLGYRCLYLSLGLNELTNSYPVLFDYLRIKITTIHNIYLQHNSISNLIQQRQ